MTSVKLCFGILLWCVIFNSSFAQFFNNNEDWGVNEIETNGDIYNYNTLPFQDNNDLLVRRTSLLHLGDNLEDKIRFFVYTKTKNGQTKCDEIKINDTTSIQQSNLKKKKVLKLLIHGFISNCSVLTFPQNIIEAYLQTNAPRYNIICVDWGPIAAPLGELRLSTLFYGRTVRNINTVGAKVARFISFMCDQKIIDAANQVHIIGFSLGAHVAGIAGSQMQTVYNSKIGRITGLDPAGPSFESIMKDMEHKLDKTDAKFVDVIHTNVGQLGIRETIAHADFFPNGGERQPRCYQEDILKSLTEVFFGSCSHRSSSLYFERSIGNKSLSACPCKSTGALQRKKATNKKCSARKSKYKTIFGENCPSSTRGSFCLDIT